MPLDGFQCRSPQLERGVSGKLFHNWAQQVDRKQQVRATCFLCLAYWFCLFFLPFFFLRDRQALAHSSAYKDWGWLQGHWHLWWDTHWTSYERKWTEQRGALLHCHGISRSLKGKTRRFRKEKKVFSHTPLLLFLLLLPPSYSGFFSGAPPNPQAGPRSTTP